MTKVNPRFPIPTAPAAPRRRVLIAVRGLCHGGLWLCDVLRSLARWEQLFDAEVYTTAEDEAPTVVVEVPTLVDNPPPPIDDEGTTRAQWRTA